MNIEQTYKYFEDLEQQRKNLQQALDDQDIETTEEEGFGSLVPKVQSVGEPVIPCIKFYTSSTSSNQLTNAQFQNIVNSINFNMVKDLSYLLYNQRSLSTIDFSGVNIKQGVPVTYMFYNIPRTAAVTFGTKNDLRGLNDIKYMVYTDDTSSSIDQKPIDYSSFILDETQNVDTKYAFMGISKLPSNIEKCKINPYGLFARAKMDETVETLDCTKLYFYKTTDSEKFTKTFAYGKFNNIIFDIGFENVEEGNAITKLGQPFYYTYANKVEFVNKDKCPLTAFSNFITHFHSTEPVDLSGLNLSNSTSLDSMCTYVYAPEIILNDVDTSHIQVFSYFFQWSYHKKFTSNSFDMSGAININNMFYNSGTCEEIPPLRNLGKGYTQQSANYSNYHLNLNLSKLSHDNVVAILDSLYDLNLTYDVANGGTLYTQKITLPTQLKNLLTADEIAIATNKG